MNKLFLLLPAVAAFGATTAVDAQSTSVECFPLQKVRLLPGSPFEHAQQMDKCYILGLDADRLLAPYRKEAGLEPKAPNYTNWENTGLDGHIGGHYLSALAQMYAATGDARIKERLDYMIAQLNECQQAAADGYLSGVHNGRAKWQQIAKGDIRASSFGLNDGWVPLYNIHKIYAGLRDAYIYAADTTALRMFLQLTEWMNRLTANLTDEQMQDMLRSEHGGLNEVFADAAALSKNDNYLTLARRFSHRAILDPLLKGEDKLTGLHANTQIPKVIGFKRIADLDANAEWDKAAQFFWQTVVENRSITIGGNSVREHFHPANDFSSMLDSEQGPETCNTYNMLRLSKMLYETSADAKYMDFAERATYNHILSTINPVQGGFVYFTPMRPAHYRVYSQPQTSFWCCVGSGMENHARYGEMIYAHKDNNLYVNMFVPSTLAWDERGISVEQRNNFPADASTTITIKCDKSSKFEIRIRKPEWLAGAMNPTVNGQKVDFKDDGGYVVVSRKWQNGDALRVELPMAVRAVQLPDGSDNFSFMYGPIVLAANMGRDAQTGLYADDSRGGHIAAGPQMSSDVMPVIIDNNRDALAHIEKTDGLKFKLTGLQPQQFENLVLEPFAQLYECRYMVYFPLQTEAKYEADKAAREAKAREHAQLEAATTDKVVCGEQQPESDHFITYQSSQTGSENGRQWRDADGWFAYKLRTDGSAEAKLRIVFAPEQSREAIVFANGKEIGRLTPATDATASFAVGIATTEPIEIKIVATQGKRTPKVYEVRTMK